MYQITATIQKAGNSPTAWIRFSKVRMTKAQCEKMLAGKTEAGVSRQERVMLENFHCIKAGE
ncbi:DUF1187 family protein [Salmonella enterica]|nr:DUF1187 family protein [Salmonella enterica]EEH2567230.1 DUF1187 family protein [Salmonella enterica]EHM3440587.1 DUF1187 family protein [Salmonella enterica subsp. enterica]EHW9181136.1 DUF1187 family protein [Salmonella enterica subsp. enterica]